jgi:hypothetical protein
VATTFYDLLRERDGPADWRYRLFHHLKRPVSVSFADHLAEKTAKQSDRSVVGEMPSGNVAAGAVEPGSIIDD